MNEDTDEYSFLISISEDRREGLPVIRSSFDTHEINRLVGEGYQTHLVMIEPNQHLYTEMALSQCMESGDYRWQDKHIWMWPDPRDLNFFELDLNEDSESNETWTELLVKRVYVRARTLRHPWGIYLIPASVKPGDKVYVEDILEDIQIDSSMGVPGLARDGVATWTGSGFEFEQAPWDEVTPCIVG